MRLLRVACCLAEVTQQIHSLRASGVRLFHAAFAGAAESITFRKSAGILCTGPGRLSVGIELQIPRPLDVPVGQKVILPGRRLIPIQIVDQRRWILRHVHD
jgi:hypothetical protein